MVSRKPRNVRVFRELGRAASPLRCPKMVYSLGVLNSTPTSDRKEGHVPTSEIEATSYTPEQRERIMGLVHTRFLALTGEPLYAEEIGTEAVQAASYHEEALADTMGVPVAPLAQVAERVARSLAYLYGYMDAQLGFAPRG